MPRERSPTKWAPGAGIPEEARAGRPSLGVDREKRAPATRLWGACSESAVARSKERPGETCGRKTTDLFPNQSCWPKGTNMDVTRMGVGIGYEGAERRQGLDLSDRDSLTLLVQSQSQPKSYSERRRARPAHESSWDAPTRTTAASDAFQHPRETQRGAVGWKPNGFDVNPAGAPPSQLLAAKREKWEADRRDWKGMTVPVPNLDITKSIPKPPPHVTQLPDIPGLPGSRIIGQDGGGRIPLRKEVHKHEAAQTIQAKLRGGAGGGGGPGVAADQRLTAQAHLAHARSLHVEQCVRRRQKGSK
jgi:hypothetical protein